MNPAALLSPGINRIRRARTRVLEGRFPVFGLRYLLKESLSSGRGGMLFPTLVRHSEGIFINLRLSEGLSGHEAL